MRFENKIRKFISGKAEYDKYGGQQIWAVNKKDELQHLLDLRGWGAIQYMFKTQEEAMEFQDELGEWIADAINQKLTK